MHMVAHNLMFGYGDKDCVCWVSRSCQVYTVFVNVTLFFILMFCIMSTRIVILINKRILCSLSKNDLSDQEAAEALATSISSMPSLRELK